MIDGEDAGAESALFDQFVSGGEPPAASPAPPAAPAPAAAPAEPQQNGQPRQPDGKFAPRAGETEQRAAAPEAPAKQPEAGKAPGTTHEQLAPEAAGVAAPPAGWSPVAKSKWDAIDADVRAAIAKREDEVSTGFKRYEGLAKHADLAERNGRSLAQEAERYSAAEKFIERDFTGAIFWLGSNQGMSPAQVIQQLSERAQGQPGMLPQGGQPQPRQQQPQDVEHVVQQALARRDADTARAQVRTELDAFTRDPAHRYYENVKEAMAALLASGQASDLKDAYDQACWGSPQIRPFVQQSPTPTTQGAPSTGQPPQGRALSPAAKRAAGSLAGAPLPSGSSTPANARAAESELFDQFVGRA